MATSTPAPAPSPAPAGVAPLPSHARPSTRATTASTSVDVAEPIVDTLWTTRGYTHNEVASMLFPDQRDQLAVHEAVRPRSRASAAGRRTCQAKQPSLSTEPFSRPLTSMDLYGASAEPQVSGRARALELATQLAREAGPRAGLSALSVRGAAALAVLPDVSREETVLSGHAALRALEAEDVAPNIEALDAGYRELTRQVGSHCTEHAMILEYLRRQHLATAACARALLGRLQLSVGLYDELRESMDGSMLQRFEESLSEALATTMEPAKPAEPAAIAAAALPPPEGALESVAPAAAPAAISVVAVAAAPTAAVAPSAKPAAEKPHATAPDLQPTIAAGAAKPADLA